MPRNPLGILPAVQAFDELVPLSDEEIAALWPLIGLRAAALAVSDAQQLAVDPGNVYTAERAHVGWHTLEGVGGFGFAFAEAAFRDALGRPDRPRPLVVSTPLVPAPARSRSAPSTSRSRAPSSTRANLLARDCEHHVLGQASVDGIAVTRYGEHRLTRSPALRTRAGDLRCLRRARPKPAQANESPWTATLVEVGRSSTELEHDRVSLRISGIAPAVAPGSTIAAGAAVGTLTPATACGSSCARPRESPRHRSRRPRAAAWRRPVPRPLSAPRARRRCAAARSGRRARAPRLGLRARAGPLLRGAATDRARLRRAPHRRDGPHLLRHGQQRRAARPRASGDDPGGHAPVHLLNTNSRFNYEVISEYGGSPRSRRGPRHRHNRRLAAPRR